MTDKIDTSAEAVERACAFYEAWAADIRRSGPSQDADDMDAHCAMMRALATRDEARAMVALLADKANCTTIISHALQDGGIAPEYVDAFEEALDDQLSAFALVADARVALERVKDEARREERERCAIICATFDWPASDSDFLNGQATAAQQIAAAIRAETKVK